MREVARTLGGLGLPAEMAKASVAWHDRVGGPGLAAGAAEFAVRADAVLAALGETDGES